MIDLIRASAVPATLMQSAARGALSVPAPEAIEILVYLAVHNKVFGMQARMTLAGWDENASKQAAANPHTPQEVLDYMIAGENLRPALLPLLLENPSVSEESLIALAASSTREVAEAMLNSPRVKATPEVLNALQSNSNLAVDESAGVEAPLVAEGFTLGGESPAAAATVNESPDAVLDEGLVAYLNANAKEIATEGEKPFQPIGGVYEDLSLDLDEPPAATPAAATTPATPAAPVAAAPAAPRKAPVQKKSHLGAEEERASALQKISKLDIKGRIQLAMRGTKEERSLLIRDGTKVVALAVLESPKVSDSEVEKFASQKNVLEAVLRQIPLNRRYVKHYGIVRNLVFNPRTPLDISLGLMKNLLVHDLRNLSGNKEVSETVRKLATKMFRQKSDTTKRRMD
ncbi:MAG TPA: hypothetical protein VKB77_13410 [Terriglobales bacterium]|nr:hypothetical protein [Terriglobales bacterium]